MNQGFWSKLKKPIIGLSPMDGVTDAAFRFIGAKYGKSHVHITEFTSAEGLAAGAVKLLDDFIYSDIERPVVAQIFGSDAEAFYKAGALVAALGFDGLDINMGCPARNVAEHGGGAALIRTPKLAQELIRAAKKGVKAWADGATLEDVGVHQAIIAQITDHKIYKSQTRNEIPVSVKTRIGYDAVVIEDWVKYLLEEEPAVISIHGRTLKQLYSGSADWDAIARAAQIIHETSTLAIGNGDAKDIGDAKAKIAAYGVDGVLIGRASFGNPWIFTDSAPSHDEKLRVAIEHARVFEELLPRKNFLHMRKHLCWYMSGFDGAKELRAALMQPSVKNAADVERIIGDWQRSAAPDLRLQESFATLIG
ncbi:MAG: tRNA-dihydrouridine synthase [bacterium]|nr:tRNA-dihydrouridine synthase [bacterium]